MCSKDYDCECLSPATGNVSGLSNQAPAVKGVEQCNGIVRVTAELDDSHSHGLEGQKIIVRIYH